MTYDMYDSNIVISSREQKEIEIKSRLIPICEEFFSKFLSKLIENERLEIYIVDLEKSSKMNYDKGFFELNLSIETSNLKYKCYNIYDDAEKFAKIVKIISILYTKSLKNISTTKRELYYNDVELFQNTQCVDSIIHDICSILKISRFDLSVFPAQKGLFAGDIIIYDLEGNMLNNSKTFDKINLISFEYYFEEIQIESNAKFILIVEKESLFFNLVSNKIYQTHFYNSIIITGKGFPDFLTKYFIKTISDHLNHLPIFYFGDYDPSGFEIFFNYLFGSKSSSRENELMSINSIIWIGLTYENILNLTHHEGLDSLTLIKLDEKEIKKIDSIISREYYNLEEWENSSNIFKCKILHNLKHIINQFDKMKEFHFKAEGEIIVSKYMEHFVNYLNLILIGEI